MSGGPEAHESTGIIFVEKQVRGGKVCHLDKQLGWGLQRPGDACLSPRPESDGAPRSQSFSLEPEVLMGLPSAQRRVPGTCSAPLT